MSDLKVLQSLSKDYSILYVEDNEVLRTKVSHLLVKFFHKVSIAKDGVEALEKLKKENYPIVITDIRMPNMDGITLIKHMKEIAPKTHVVVMSAFDDKEYLLEFIELGVFRFLKKPINLSNLTDTLYQVIVDIKENTPKEIVQEVKVEAIPEPKIEPKVDEDLHNTKLLFSILEDLKERKEKIELHNYYKGLSITDYAEIVAIDNKTLKIKTTFMQKKSMHIESKTTIASESLPYVVECAKVYIASFEDQFIELKHLHFTKTSPIDRSTIRVYPKDRYTISLFSRGKEIKGSMKIEDISLDALRVSFDALPAGLKDSQEIRLELTLEEHTHVNTTVKILRIDENEDKYHIVFVFESNQKKILMKYITKSQMAIIREFKGIKNG